MKKQCLSLAAIITAAAMTFPSLARAGTAEVYQASMSLHGLFQGTNDLTDIKEIQTAVFYTKDIINLALGNPFNGAVSSNDVLAYVNSGSTNSIIVYNKSTGSNLVTVATVTSRGSVSQPNVTDFIWKISVVDLGGATNSFEGGELQAEGSKTTKGSTFDVDSRVDGTIDADSYGNGFHVLVPYGSLTFGTPAIGKIVTTP